MVICQERGADLHMAQLMLLPLTVCCFSKIQIGFTFLVLDKGPLNGRVCKWSPFCSVQDLSPTQCWHFLITFALSAKRSVFLQFQSANLWSKLSPKPEILQLLQKCYRKIHHYIQLLRLFVSINHVTWVNMLKKFCITYKPLYNISDDLW